MPFKPGLYLMFFHLEAPQINEKQISKTLDITPYEMEFYGGILSLRNARLQRSQLLISVL